MSHICFLYTSTHTLMYQANAPSDMIWYEMETEGIAKSRKEEKVTKKHNCCESINFAISLQILEQIPRFSHSSFPSSSCPYSRHKCIICNVYKFNGYKGERKRDFKQLIKIPAFFSHTNILCSKMCWCMYKHSRSCIKVSTLWMGHTIVAEQKYPVFVLFEIPNTRL